MKFDELGACFKESEDTTTLPLSLFTLLRIDGKTFHSFTNGLKRPYDERLMMALDETTKKMMGDFPCLHYAYTQSDEVSFLLKTETIDDMPFKGRVQKVLSVMVSSFTAHFAQQRALYMPYFKPETIAAFDGRLFSLQSQEETIAYFEWRELDAVRNAVSMAARSHFSSKQLFKKSRSEMIEMMKEKGVYFDDYPLRFRKGVYLAKVVKAYTFTPEEIAALPPLHHARTGKETTYTRTIIEESNTLNPLLWV